MLHALNARAALNIGGLGSPLLSITISTLSVQYSASSLNSQRPAAAPSDVPEIAGVPPWAFTPQRFGAVANGVADDTPAIVAAAIAASVLTGSGPGQVYLPAGNYRLGSPITGTYSSVILRGAGPGRTVLRAAGDFPVVTGAWHNSQWQDMTLDAGMQGSPGIEVHLDRCLLTHVYIAGWRGFGMKLNDGQWSDALGHLNRIVNCDVEQQEGVGIHTGYRFTDSWIQGCNIGSTGENVNLEGGPVRLLHNHLNGSPDRNIVLRGNRRVMIAHNILEGSRREAIRWDQPPWETFDSHQQVQIISNAISNGGKLSAGTYSAIALHGLTPTQRGVGFQIAGNVIACEDPGSGWKHCVEGVNVRSVTATANVWSTGHLDAEPVRLVGSDQWEVAANAGDNQVATL